MYNSFCPAKTWDIVRYGSQQDASPVKAFLDQPTFQMSHPQPSKTAHHKSTLVNQKSNQDSDWKSTLVKPMLKPYTELQQKALVAAPHVWEENASKSDRTNQTQERSVWWVNDEMTSKSLQLYPSVRVCDTSVGLSNLHYNYGRPCT